MQGYDRPDKWACKLITKGCEYKISNSTLLHHRNCNASGGSINNNNNDKKNKNDIFINSREYDDVLIEFKLVIEDSRADPSTSTAIQCIVLDYVAISYEGVVVLSNHIEPPYIVYHHNATPLLQQHQLYQYKDIIINVETPPSIITITSHHRSIQNPQIMHTTVKLSANASELSNTCSGSKEVLSNTTPKKRL